MDSPREGDVIEVEWVDSKNIEYGWDTIKSYIKKAKGACNIFSCGYLVYQDDKIVLLTHSVDKDLRTLLPCIAIPKCSITNITVLGRCDDQTHEVFVHK